jgi:hypothetical protein
VSIRIAKVAGADWRGVSKCVNGHVTQSTVVTTGRSSMSFDNDPFLVVSGHNYIKRILIQRRKRCPQINVASWSIFWIGQHRKDLVRKGGYYPQIDATLHVSLWAFPGHDDRKKVIDYPLFATLFLCEVHSIQHSTKQLSPLTKPRAPSLPRVERSSTYGLAIPSRDVGART